MSDKAKTSKISERLAAADEGEVIDFSQDLSKKAPPPVDTPTEHPHPLATRLVALDEIEERENSRPAYYGIEDLGNSLLMQGQIQACVVRPAAPDAPHGKQYELIVGYRRKRAAESIGWTELRVDVRDLSDREIIEMLIAENYGREDLTPIAEANAMHRLISDYGLTQREVARRLGVDPSQVSHRLKLLKLGVSILDKLDQGKMSVSVAETISSLSNSDAQERLARLATRNDWSARKAEAWVRDYKEHGESTDEGQDEVKPLNLVSLDDARELPHLRVRDDVTDVEVARLALYALLRNGQDQETLEYIEEKHGFAYEALWPYVASLTDEEVAQLTRDQALRFVGAAHRLPSLEPTLKAQFAARPAPRPHDGDPFEES